MRRTLSDAESQLTAFVFQKYLVVPVPHTAFHSLESTHLKTILAHNTWYKTYKTLNSVERSTIDQLLRPMYETRQRELVSLKVLQENKVNAWAHLCADLLRGPPINSRPHAPNYQESGAGRSILVICREKLVNGKTIQDFIARGGPAPPPPPPGARPPLPSLPKAVNTRMLKRPRPDIPRLGYPSRISVSSMSYKRFLQEKFITLILKYRLTVANSLRILWPLLLLSHHTLILAYRTPIHSLHYPIIVGLH